jgi:methylthioribose-1-phosphate isomerase
VLPALEWKDDRLVMIDQRKLPLKEIYLEYADHNGVARAIETMVVRGAPAIGVAAAYGVALGVLALESAAGLDRCFDAIYRRLERTRPTARNLFWALERMRRAFELNKGRGLVGLKRAMVAEARAIEREDVETNKAIGRHGRDLIKDGWTVLTHCNAGELATAGYGTAIGVIRAAHDQGKKIRVFADETRPFLQGARLTCWELDRRGIPVVLITDSMAGWFMKNGEIQAAVVGADRIARNGDTANKIGTYSVAVLAKEHGIPFYVAAPMSTVDASLKTGAEIPIEERNAREVRTIGGRCVTLPGIAVRNPAFDVTPAKYITGIVTEEGVFRPPYRFKTRVSVRLPLRS